MRVGSVVGLGKETSRRYRPAPVVLKRTGTSLRFFQKEASRTQRKQRSEREWGQHNPKANEVEPAARIVPETEGATDAPGEVVERAAPQHTGELRRCFKIFPAIS